MSVIYMMRRGNELLICDREMFNKNGKEITVGFPRFRLKAEGQLTAEGDDIEKMMGKMQEGKSYKMVLKRWPIE